MASMLEVDWLNATQEEFFSVLSDKIEKRYQSFGSLVVSCVTILFVKKEHLGLNW